MLSVKLNGILKTFLDFKLLLTKFLLTHTFRLFVIMKSFVGTIQKWPYKKGYPIYYKI